MSLVRNYWLFMWPRGSARGGAHDFFGWAETLDEARERMVRRARNEMPRTDSVDGMICGPSLQTVLYMADDESGLSFSDPAAGGER